MTEQDKADIRRSYREAREPCERCKPSEYPPDYYGPHSFPIVENEIYFYDTDDGWEGEEINFCPWCGRPLTNAAWQMLEKRLDKICAVRNAGPVGHTAGPKD